LHNSALNIMPEVKATPARTTIEKGSVAFKAIAEQAPAKGKTINVLIPAVRALEHCSSCH
jgi:hypothetical protein